MYNDLALVYVKFIVSEAMVISLCRLQEYDPGSEKGIRIRHNNDGPASDADYQPSPREKFRVKSFISIIECPHAIQTKRVFCSYHSFEDISI